MKNKIIILFFLPLIIFSGCEEKFQYKNSPNAVTTLVTSNVLQVSATVAGVVNTDNGSYITERGICYGTADNPTTDNSKKLDANPDLGDFSCIISKLLPSTTYYARAYATNSYGTAYGKSVSFVTLDATTPILESTIAPNAITPVSAKCGGIITNSGAADVTARGVCWSSTNANPTIFDSKSSDGSGIGTYSSSMANLNPNTRYNVRAYAANSVGTAYGDVKTFTTSASTIPVLTTTSTATSITLTTATSGGTISSDGGATVSARGVCYSTSTTNPTILNDKTNNGSGIGSFVSALTYLSAGSRYYVRSYATNQVGTAYGPSTSFSTLSPTLPIINYVTTSAITYTTATSGGTISNDGGAMVTSRGVCWSNSTSSPTIINSKTTDGSGTGTFNSSLTGLTSNTTYYVRAYATNSAGTAYSSSTSFRTTLASLPVVSLTTTVSSITSNSASSGGTISSDGGAVITSKGVCWSNYTSSPTISDSRTVDGSGIGTYSSSIASLTPNTVYYVRAYATNSAGTSYGSAKSFTTLSLPVTIGQSYQGGIVGYIFQSGDAGYVSGQIHGLIVSSGNISSGSQWGCYGTNISGTSTSLGAGSANTTNIFSGCYTNNAAYLCLNYNSGGYSDWYLPSRDELYKLYLNSSSIGGFSSSNYWSSSQYNSSYGWYISFSSGSQGGAPKSSSLYVRAIRTF